MAEAFGWWKLTVSWGFVPKLCQLIAVFCVAWLMAVTFPDWLIVAAPDVTTPPCGAAQTGPARSWHPQAAITMKTILFLNILLWFDCKCIMSSFSRRYGWQLRYS
jgi:hypothetical protein